MKQRGSTVKLKGWQALVALTVGAVFAGAPTPALPLSAHDVAVPARIDRAGGGAADALAIRTILRLGAAGRATEASKF